MKAMPEFVRSSGPQTSPERLAELEAMLDANPQVRRRRELASIREKRPLTSEETAEYEEIMKPIRELEKLGNMMA